METRQRATPDQEGELFAPNGSQIIGTYERIMGRGEIVRDSFKLGADGLLEFEWAGGTEVFWDSAETVEVGGQRVFLDRDGEEWSEAQLVAALTGREIPQDAPAEVIGMPAGTLQRVEQALNNMINAGEGMRGTRDGIALDNLRRHATEARASLRELATVKIGGKQAQSIAAEMIAMPSGTLARVGAALSGVCMAAKPHLIDTDGDDGRDLADALDNARSAQRELSTVTSMARSCAAAEQREPRVIDGGMAWDNAPDGAALIYDGDGRMVCELKPALLEGLSIEARAELAQHIGQALGLITVAP